MGAYLSIIINTIIEPKVEGGPTFRSGPSFARVRFNYNIAIAANYDGSLEIIQLVEEQESGHHTVVACNKWVSVLISFFSIRCLCVG